MNGNVAFEFGALLGQMQKQAAHKCPQCGKADCKCPAYGGKKKKKKNPFEAKAAQVNPMVTFGAVVKQAADLQLVQPQMAKEALNPYAIAGLGAAGGLALPGVAKGIGSGLRGVGNLLQGNRWGHGADKGKTRSLSNVGAGGSTGGTGEEGEGGDSDFSDQEQLFMRRYGLNMPQMRAQNQASNALFGGAGMQNMLHKRMMNQAQQAYAL